MSKANILIIIKCRTSVVKHASDLVYVVAPRCHVVFSHYTASTVANSCVIVQRPNMVWPVDQLKNLDKKRALVRCMESITEKLKHFTNFEYIHLAIENYL